MDKTLFKLQQCMHTGWPQTRRGHNVLLEVFTHRKLNLAGTIRNKSRETLKKRRQYIPDGGIAWGVPCLGICAMVVVVK